MAEFKETKINNNTYGVRIPNDYRARDNRWYANISFRTKRITRVFKTKEEAVAWRQAQEEVVRRGEEIA